MEAPVVTQIDGARWLTISYTPAPDREARRVYYAVWLRERTFEIKKTGRRFLARDAGGHLQIRLNAEGDERALLKDLCF